MIDEPGQKSTYLLHGFAQQDAELARLKKQGSLLPQLELSYLLSHGLKPNMKVLDAACGPGLTSVMIDSYLDEGEVVGTDIDRLLLGEAQALAEKENRDITFVEADVYNLPFDQSFDYIYCRFLFQHLVDPLSALASLKRALKPGGILHILDVNDEWLFLYPEVPAFNRLRELAIAHQGKKGGNRLIGKSLRNLLLKAEFEEVKVDLIPVHSDLTGMKTFIEITTRFKKLQIDPEEAGIDPELLIQEIDEALTTENHFGMVGVFSVSGKK